MNKNSANLKTRDNKKEKVIAGFGVEKVWSKAKAYTVKEYTGNKD